MSKTYRVAVVGCGGMGHHHAKTLVKNPRVQLVAAMDAFPEALEKFSKEYQVPAYADIEAMIRKEKVQLVFITTWQSVRAELTVAAAKAGVKGIFGEKPMAASLGEANQMVAACRKHKVKLVIGHQRRYMPVNVTARKLIQAGAIGRPQVMMRRDGYGLLNRGTHEIDEMLYILGDPKALWLYGQVTRKTDKWERRVRCEDRCMAEICFEGGFRGIYESDLPEPVLCGHAVYGDEGILRRGENGTLMLMNLKSPGWQVIYPEPVGTDQLTEFLDWLDGKVKGHRNAGETARTTMEIMMAIYESVRLRDVVTFPLKTKRNPLDLLVEEGRLPVEVDGRYDIRAPFPEQKK
ncbi:MAG: Gfo/Idh/MocA family oxidoreductase [Planctomycetes bacterium]|nr:Gfo/Idh/MocA family oxidoreductase [Planctomycetota bacterium]